MNAPVRFCDAHNHLQDDRFAGRQETILRAATEAGVTRMVVNGACEADWPAVAALARNHPGLVQPSFGWHPWYLDERGPDWEDALARQLDAQPDAFVGEIGLDRWMLDQPDRWRALLAAAGQTKSAPPSLAEQESAFIAQLRLAAARNRPASIHCLHAFGRLRELLATHPRPERGFLLHSYGGPAEMLPALAQLGGYFSFPGYFLHERKARQREVFRRVPPDRLLVETDAPDQLPPESARPHRLEDASGRPLNHPANLPAIYSGLAALLGESVEALARRVAENYARLFGP
jgi:TatD DNase family protein